MDARRYQEEELIGLLRQFIQPLDAGLTWDDAYVREQENRPGHYTIFAGWRCSYCLVTIEARSAMEPKKFVHKNTCPIRKARWQVNWFDMWDK